VPELGKLSPKFLQEVILGRLGAPRAELLQGPMFGVDNAVVRVAEGTVAICTTDPISIIPALGVDASAWLSVHLLASDVTTSGFPPAFAVFDLNLPPKMEDAELEAYWTSIHRACEELSVAIIGGHTGRFVGCDYTIMGGGVMIAVGPEEKYLTSSMAQTGDILLLTKGCAISTTGILTYAFSNTIERELGSKFLKHAQAFLRKSSTAKDALTAASVGVRDQGVTAMHDVTEGGVLGGIFELVSASRKGARIDQESIQVSEEAREVCRLFEIDPFTSLSEGSLAISVRPEKSDRVRAALDEAAIQSSVVGEVLAPESGIVLVGDSGVRMLEYPEKDPYWDAYWHAVEKGWT
jgi:hydrogenase maturation factor